MKSLKFISIFLVIALIVSSIPFTLVSTFAETISDNTFVIDSVEDFNQFVEDVNASTSESPYSKNVRFDIDIDLNPGFTFNPDGTYTSDIDGAEPEKWTPLGKKVGEKEVDKGQYRVYTAYISGNIDGNGHKIKGMYIPGKYYDTERNNNLHQVGFFGLIMAMNEDSESQQVFSGLTFENCYVQASYDRYQKDDMHHQPELGSAGCFAGRIEGRTSEIGPLVKDITISDTCYINADRNVGGVVGFPLVRVDFDNCVNEGTVAVSNIYDGEDTGPELGGIAGWSSAVSTYTNCVNRGTLVPLDHDTHMTNDVGGILGGTSANNNFYYCTNESKVEGVDCIGGILGFDNGGTVKIENCKNDAAVEGKNYVGGFCGAVTGKDTEFSIKYCNTTENSKIKAEENHAGGCVGRIYNKQVFEIKNSKILGTVTANDAAAGAVGCVNNGDDVNTTGVVSDCVNYATITSTNRSGGFCGYSGGFVNVEKSANVGLISANQYSGGIVAHCNEKNFVIKQCYNKGEIKATDASYAYAGGLVGYAQGDDLDYLEIADAYNLGTINASNNSAGIIGFRSAKKTGTYKLQNVYNAGEFTNTTSSTISGVATFAGDPYSLTINYVYCRKNAPNRKCFSSNNSEKAMNSIKDTPFFSGGKEQSEFYMGLTVNKERWTTKEVDYSEPYPVRNEANKIIQVNTDCYRYYTHLIAIEDMASSYPEVDFVPADVIVSYELPKTEVAAYSADISSKVNTIFYMTMNNNNYDGVENKDAVVTITAPETDETFIENYPLEEADAVEFEGKLATFYKFSCGISAKEMTQKIKIEVKDKSDGTVVYSTQCTLQEYADKILKNASSYPKKDVNVTKKMLNYGAYSQLNFGYHTDDLANKNLESKDKEISATDDVKSAVENFGYVESGSKTKVQLYGTTLSLRSDLVTKIYLIVKCDVSDVTFKVNSEIVDAELDGNVYRLDVKTPLKNLDQPIIVEAGGYQLKYYPASYIKLALNSKTTSESLKNLCDALYDFYIATNEGEN